MAWIWQGKTYETRAALDEAKRRHYESISAEYCKRHLESLKHDEEMRRKYAAVSAKYRADHLAKLREGEKVRRHYAEITAQYRPKRRFTFALD